MKKSRSFAICAAVIGFVTPMSASASGYQCDFEISCYEEVGCKEVDLKIQVNDLTDETAELVTPGSTFPMIKQIDLEAGIVTGTVAYTSLLTSDAMYLLTIYPNQSSRLSIHAYLTDALTIQSRGTCKLM